MQSAARRTKAQRIVHRLVKRMWITGAHASSLPAKGEGVGPTREGRRKRWGYKKFFLLFANKLSRDALHLQRWA